MNKREKAIYYAEQQTKNGSCYVWSGQGEKLLKLTIKDIIAMEQSLEAAARVFKHIAELLINQKITSKSKVFDCSGLVIKALIYAGVLHAGFDTTADGLLKKFPEPSEAWPGDLVFKVNANGKAYHVGILKDKQTVIEAAGRETGIIESPYNSKWNAVRTPY